MNGPRGVRGVRALLVRRLGEVETRALESELTELWEARVARDGRAAADRWYRREVVRFAVRLLIARPHRTKDGGLGGMEWRQAARVLRRSPVSTLAIVLTLGLGLGGTVAMWAVADAVLIRPLPYASPDRLVRVYHAIQGNRWSLSAVDWEAIREQQTEFAAMAAARSGSETLAVGNESERVSVRSVTPGWFEVLGVGVASGRSFVAADGEPGAPATVLLSHGYWQRRFGGRDVVGTRLRLNDVEHEVVGVLAETGPLEERHDLFPALRLEPATRKGPFFLTVIGRLRQGASAERAEAELRAINARIFPIWESSWQDRSATYGVMTLSETVTGRVRGPLFALLGAVFFVLLVATLNAANLLLARAAERRREFAVRIALGAARPRIARLLLAESALVCAAGTAVGLALAALALRTIAAAGPDLLPRAAGVTLLDARVAAVSALLAGGCALFCGLIPAMQALRTAEPAAGLREGGRTATGSRRAERVRMVLVAAQFAIAAPLLVGAGLLLHGFETLQDVDTGFDPRNVISAGIALPPAAYGDQQDLALFWRLLLDGVASLPGVDAAGLSDARPPRTHPGSNNFDLEDRPAPPGDSQPGAIWLSSSPGYFEALGIPLIAGRRFAPSDGPGAPIVVLVDEAWVRAHSPDRDPLGRRFRAGGCTGPDCELATIVGVVGDVRYTGLDDPGDGSVRGTIYTLADQSQPSFAYLYVRSARSADEVIAGVRGVLRSIDAAVPLFDVATAAALRDEALAAPRRMTLLASGFAAVALLLAVVAIYGVMAYFVERSRRDIGIRMALGGPAREVAWGIVQRGMRPVVAGLAIGALLSLATGRVLSGLVFGVRAIDPFTHGGVLLLLLATAGAACLVPASRATRRRPLAALRED